MTRSLFALSIFALGLGLAHCTKAPQEVVAPERVENRDLGIAIAALPSAFSVANASGPEIVLEAAGAAGSGRAVITAGPEEQFGINLIEAIKERKALFESAPGGEYFGNRELGTPTGTAFTARGAYDGEYGPVEETWVYSIHPMANRVLTITYTYPTGESQERVGQLLELLGEIQGIGSAAPSE